MPGGLVGGHQAAEADVVARGVLDPGQDALASQLDQHVALQLDPAQAHRDVVGEQGGVNRPGDGPEVLGDLLGVVLGVEGAGGHDGLGAQVDGAAGLGDDALGGGVDGPGQDRHAPGRRAHGALDDGVALGVGEVGDLAGGAQGEQGVDASGDEVLDHCLQAVQVEVALGGEGGDDRRDDAGESGVHVSCCLSMREVRGGGRGGMPSGRSAAGGRRRPEGSGLRRPGARGPLPAGSGCTPDGGG